jgi:protein phosphatase
VLEGRLDNRPLRDAPSPKLLTALDMRVATEPLSATIAGVSCAGLRRNINEDALAWVDTGRWRLVVVADGMGGNMSGEPASRAAVAAMLTVLDTEADDEEDAKDKLHTAYERARVQVGTFEDIGTTLVCALVGGGVAHILHIGHSLAWRVTRSGVVARLTEPHTLESRMVQMGRDPDDPNVRRHRNILVRSLFRPAAEGNESTTPDYCCVPLPIGEHILLATDGLSDLVSDDQIGAILAGTSGPRAGVAALLRAAYEAGAPDNITIAVFTAP